MCYCVTMCVGVTLSSFLLPAWARRRCNHVTAANVISAERESCDVCKRVALSHICHASAAANSLTVRPPHAVPVFKSRHRTARHLI
jgi:hypothetical protein